MPFEGIAIRMPGVGSKRVCVGCAARFYDLTRSPAVCPKCGVAQPPIAPRAVSPRRGAEPRRPFRQAAPAIAAEAEEPVEAAEAADDDEDADEEADDEVIEEADEITGEEATAEEPVAT